MLERSVLLLFFFVCACQNKSRQALSKIPNPKLPEKKQAYFVLKSNYSGCLMDLLPDSNLLNSETSWSIMTELISDELVFRERLLEINARNPDLIVLAPGLNVSNLRLAKNAKTKLVFLEASNKNSDTASNLNLFFSWKDLGDLSKDFCHKFLAKDKESCEKAFLNCPSAAAASYSSRPLLSLKYSENSYLKAVVDWPAVFDRLLEQALTTQRVDLTIMVNNALLQIRVSEGEWDAKPELEKQLKLWSLSKLAETR